MGVGRHACCCQQPVVPHKHVSLGELMSHANTSVHVLSQSAASSAGGASAASSGAQIASMTTKHAYTTSPASISLCNTVSKHCRQPFVRCPIHRVFSTVAAAAGGSGGGGAAAASSAAAGGGGGPKPTPKPTAKPMTMMPMGGSGGGGGSAAGTGAAAGRKLV